MFHSFDFILFSKTSVTRFSELVINHHARHIFTLPVPFPNVFCSDCRLVARTLGEGRGGGGSY